MWCILRSFCKTSSYWTASGWWPDCHPSRCCQPNGSSPCIARSLVRRTNLDSCRTSQNRRKCWARSSKCWARLSSWCKEAVEHSTWRILDMHRCLR